MNLIDAMGKGILNSQGFALMVVLEALGSPSKQPVTKLAQMSGQAYGSVKTQMAVLEEIGQIVCEREERRRTVVHLVPGRHLLPKTAQFGESAPKNTAVMAEPARLADNRSSLFLAICTGIGLEPEFLRAKTVDEVSDIERLCISKGIDASGVTAATEAFYKTMAWKPIREVAPPSLEQLKECLGRSLVVDFGERDRRIWFMRHDGWSKYASQIALENWGLDKYMDSDDWPDDFRAAYYGEQNEVAG